jgi:3'-5' exoribonuclease
MEEGEARGVAKTFVKDIQPNQEVSSSFVVAEKQLRTARNGTPFLTLKLVDKTGEIVGRIWEKAAEAADALPSRGVVFVRGRTEKFRDELQLQIQEFSPLSLKEIDPADFLPVSPLSSSMLMERLGKSIANLKKRPLQRLMKHLLGDTQLMERFKLAPAAKSMHHAYLGGLLEHTVSVVELVSRICDLYADLDRDILIVGAILHDIGKVEEFSYDLFIDYSHAGRLLGHMILGVQILDEKIRTMRGFPVEEALLLKHLILSHHGEERFGAVRLPMTREAYVLHHADDLDAKMNSLTRILSDSRETAAAWTPYQPMYERFFFRGLPHAGEESPPFETKPAQECSGQLSIWPAGK